jgi:hypothetical protein
MSTSLNGTRIKVKEGKGEKARRRDRGEKLQERGGGRERSGGGRSKERRRDEGGDRGVCSRQLTFR